MGEEVTLSFVPVEQRQSLDMQIFILLKSPAESLAILHTGSAAGGVEDVLLRERTQALCKVFTGY